jgi:C-22 sterol desaturase
VPIAKDILGHKAWVFLQGKAHAEYRRGLTPLFTNKAMATYLPVQEKVLTDYFDKFVAASRENQAQPMAFMTMFIRSIEGEDVRCFILCSRVFSLKG